MKKKRIFFIIIIAVAIVAIYFVTTITASQKRKNEFKEGYEAYLDENIEEYLNDLDTYGKQLNVTDISYEITKVSKGIYATEFVPWISISVKYDNDTSDSTKKKLLAYEIQDEVTHYGRHNVKINDKFSPSYFISGYSGATIEVSLNDEKIFSYPTKMNNEKSNSSNSSDTVKCKSCGRKFDSDSENAKSIRRTNMCTNCYNNFKSMSDGLKEMPKD